MQRFMALDDKEERVECNSCLSTVALQLTTIADELLVTYEVQNKDCEVDTAQYNIIMTIALLSSFLLAVSLG